MPVVFKPGRSDSGIRLGGTDDTADSQPPGSSRSTRSKGKGVKLHSGAGVADVSDGVDNPKAKRDTKPETKPKPKTDEEKAAEAAKRQAEEEAAARAYEKAIAELTRAAALEAFEAHLSGTTTVPADGALAELERVRAEMVAHGHSREAEQLGERLAAELELLLGATSPTAGSPTATHAPAPLPPPAPAGPPAELIALARAAGDAVRPMLATGRARREGPGMSFYFPRDDQPYALIQLVRALNELGARGELGWAADLQDEFMRRLPG